MPESLEHLTYFNDDLKINIPSSVKYLCVNTLKENMVPSSVIHLKFYRHEKMKKFPLVSHLSFGSDFYGAVENKIPYGVKHITFGNYFHKINKNSIPTSVTHIVIGHNVDISIKYIPSSVTHLTIYKENIYREGLSKKIKNVILYNDDEIPEELRSESSDGDSYSEEIYRSGEIYESDEEIYPSSISDEIDRDD